MRTFKLVRSNDLSGVSGVGVVAEGAEFDTGQIAICWLSKYHAIGIYENLHVLDQVHGHNGSTVVKWDDEADK